MSCEEFERVALDPEGEPSVTAADRAAALEHAALCPRCAALEESWRAAKADLSVWGAATQAAVAPSRVEMRLRQEFRARYGLRRARRAALVAWWGLAAATVIIGAVTWVNWRHAQRALPATSVKTPTATPNPSGPVGAPQTSAVLASNMEGFTLLPGSDLSDSDDASIVRVRMQRGTLGALGVPVAEDRAGDWIQVDLLVADDGLPQAVRLSN